MNSVKVAMGFLEVAAAMKFISNVDLIWKWGIFTRPVVLAIWIALFGVLAVYLLGKFQLPHDSKPERIGAFRLMSAVVSLAISFFLLTGLFGAKLGEIVFDPGNSFFAFARKFRRIIFQIRRQERFDFAELRAEKSGQKKETNR